MFISESEFVLYILVYFTITIALKSGWEKESLGGEAVERLSVGTVIYPWNYCRPTMCPSILNKDPGGPRWGIQGSLQKYKQNKQSKF